MLGMNDYVSKLSLVTDKGSIRSAVNCLEDLNKAGNRVHSTFERIQNTFAKLGKIPSSTRGKQPLQIEDTSGSRRVAGKVPDFTMYGGQLSKEYYQSSEDMRNVGGNWKPPRGPRNAGGGGGGNWYADSRPYDEGGGPGGPGGNDQKEESGEEKSDRTSGVFKSALMLYVLKKLLDFIKNLTTAIAKLTIASINEASALRRTASVSGVSADFAKNIKMMMDTAKMGPESMMDLAKSITSAKAKLNIGESSEFEDLARRAQLIGMDPSKILGQTTEETMTEILETIRKSLISGTPEEKRRAYSAGGQAVGDDVLGFIMRAIDLGKTIPQLLTEASKRTLTKTSPMDTKADEAVNTALSNMGEILATFGKIMAKELLPELQAFNKWFVTHKEEITANVAWLVSIFDGIFEALFKFIENLSDILALIRGDKTTEASGPGKKKGEVLPLGLGGIDTDENIRILQERAAAKLKKDLEDKALDAINRRYERERAAQSAPLLPPPKESPGFTGMGTPTFTLDIRSNIPGTYTLKDEQGRVQARGGTR